MKTQKSMIARTIILTLALAGVFAIPAAIMRAQSYESVTDDQTLAQSSDKSERMEVPVGGDYHGGGATGAPQAAALPRLRFMRARRCAHRLRCQEGSKQAAWNMDPSAKQ